MTRINVVPVQELTEMHLKGEYKEITRIPGYLNRSLKSKKGFDLSDIPSAYTLGEGHCKFFYNKCAWLERRYVELGERLRKEFNVNAKMAHIDLFKSVGEEFYGDYEPDEAAMEINRERIQERLKEK